MSRKMRSVSPTFSSIARRATLRRALKLVRGLLRKPVTDLDAHVMAGKLIDELHIAGWEIERQPGGHVGFISSDHDGP